MDGVVSVLQKYPGLSVLAFSFIFRLVNRLVQIIPLPRVVEHDDFHSWKWRNLCVSLLHSLLSGTWAVTCVILWPEILENIYYYTPLSYILICVSTGYFVHDAGDIVLNGHSKGSWEFLLHHLLVSGCFLYALYTQRYVAGSVIALIVEVNSFTLNIRLLLKLIGAQSSMLYNMNKILNIFTYICFRLSAQLHITWSIIQNISWLDHSGYFLTIMIIMNTMILIYFYRLVRSDFFPQNKAYINHSGRHKDNSTKFLN
ncbi:TLC domain-containing protein 1-like [Myxocyprinus asiaticus]|uniref:TLC domain-containing protein 1-like n=1 Tax=Myxocyprinus asiaticus TaxID=70543 RepID=UPI0022217EA8|nr:TLC domain-containing protein 1-like [Myxocyprinus asiaticus]